MKIDRNFRLSQQAKRDLSGLLDPEQRRQVKQALIDAEVSAALAARRTPRETKETNHDITV